MILERVARETLTPVELNRGSELRFRLGCGRTVSMVLEDCSARTLLTNLHDTRLEQPAGGTMLEMTARVRVDGHAVELRRYICAQESFYEPYVINGLRVWFDALQDLFYLVEETHGPCRPELAARFAVQDASLPVCPEPLRPWTDLPGERLSIEGCYNGDDPWMGPYRGASAHGGLDINQPAGSKLYAPLALDDHYYYNSVAAGHVNNRWRGVRRWGNGDVWTLQACHLIELTVPAHTPLAAGQEYASTAGTWVGDHQHSHFVFKVTSQGSESLLDPWILFREMYENAKAERGALRAAMTPLAPVKTGEAVKLSADGSRAPDGAEFLWTFGDGSAAAGRQAAHVFARSGVYPVTLTVSAPGGGRDCCTQLVTVDGPQVDGPALALAAPDEPAFLDRAAWVADVYGEAPALRPRTLHLVARSSRPVPAERHIEVVNAGGGTLAEPWASCTPGADWLNVEAGAAGLTVRADAAGLAPGVHATEVSVDCPGAANSPQTFRVDLEVRADAPAADVTVDDRDAGFFSTPFFWLAPSFCKWPERYGAGRGGRYLTGGNRPEPGQFARFTPDLAAGNYRVSLSPETPFAKVAGFRREGPMRFRARIRHAEGDGLVWVSPTESLEIGSFRFDEGTDGFVEVLAEGSHGQVLVDAVRFERVS